MNKKLGNLFVVSTPIGNLGDITYRAVEVLKSVDFIAALPRNATGKVLKRNLREEVVGSDAPAIT